MENERNTELKLAETVWKACLNCAREGFQDASMSGLCMDGAMEAAISAIEKLDLDKVIDEFHKHES